MKGRAVKNVDNPEPAVVAITADYGQTVKFRDNHPDKRDRIDLPIQYPDFSIRLTYYAEQDHFNVEIEEFKFEVTAGAQTVEIAYQFDHWSDTAYHNCHPEHFAVGNRAFTLWHYASREGLTYKEFIIEDSNAPRQDESGRSNQKEKTSLRPPPRA